MKSLEVPDGDIVLSVIRLLLVVVAVRKQESKVITEIYTNISLDLQAFGRTHH